MPIRVLVIDDDPMTCELLELFLECKGAEAIISDFPIYSLGLIRRVQPDVVLLDLFSNSCYAATDNLATMGV